MAEASHAKRFARWEDSLAAIPDPLERLDAVRKARERVEALEEQAVVDARGAGITWKAIGALYRLSKQGAQQRFRTAASDEMLPDEQRG